MYSNQEREMNLRLIREIRDALLEADLDVVAGYQGRFVECIRELTGQRNKAEARVRVLEEALREISKGEGPFSKDHLKHAANCIENMKNIAITALVRDGPAEPA